MAGVERKMLGIVMKKIGIADFFVKLAAVAFLMMRLGIFIADFDELECFGEISRTFGGEVSDFCCNFSYVSGINGASGV